MMKPDQKSPTNGGGRGEVNKSEIVHQGSSTGYTSAQEEIKQLRYQGFFDEADFLKWDIHTFSDKHGISYCEIRQLLKSTRPKLSADRFEWLEAVTRCHRLGVRGLRVANALFAATGAHGYCWPSQKRLGLLAGYKDTSEVRRGLADLVALGAIRKLKIHNLPLSLSEIALRSKTEGGSGRSLRGIAYAILPPKEWIEHKIIGTLCPSNSRNSVSLLNHKYNQKSLRDDSSSIKVSSSETLQNVDTYMKGHDVSELRVYEGVACNG